MILATQFLCYLRYRRDGRRRCNAQRLRHLVAEQVVILSHLHTKALDYIAASLRTESQFVTHRCLTLLRLYVLGLPLECQIVVLIFHQSCDVPASVLQISRGR